MSWLIDSLPSVDAIGAWYRGRSKFILHEWELVTRITNISNCPVELETFTLKCRKHVPVENDSDTGLSEAQGINNFLERSYYAQYGVDTVTDSKYGPNHPGFKLTDLRRFNEFFKICKCIKQVIQPGESVKITKFKKKSRTYNSADISNSATTGVSREIYNHFMKGGLFYYHRVTGVPQTQSGSTDPTLCDVNLDTVWTMRARTSILPYDRFDAVAAPGQLATGQTIKLIFPGTSAAGTAAPAT